MSFQFNVILLYKISVMQDTIHLNNIIQQKVPLANYPRSEHRESQSKRRQTCAVSAEDEKKHLLHAILLS